MKPAAVTPGDIVISRAGRDEGKYYAVLAMESPDFVMLTDGDLRKLDRPKRKRIKHLKPTYQAISMETMQNDAGIRKALSAMKPEKEG